MWIVIRFDRLNDIQANEAVLHTQEEVMNFINTALRNYKNAKLVMVPTASHQVQRKLVPLVTSDKCDFYAQWFD